jgi:DNA-binding MarR family transcriptional regulator
MATCKTSETEKNLTHTLLEFYEKMNSWEHSVVRDSDISHTQMHAIEIIGHHRNLKISELARRMGVTTGTTTVMVDRLEQKGLVSRRPYENDRRAYSLVLTDEGWAYFEEHQVIHHKLTQEIISELDEAEIRSLYEILEKAIMHL